ncbi:hypothetical protein TWF730_007036 [Orbilia blumenaviensis]|uniref:Uncharacterized protein n=1 Tax=Orbilia blumenaviensis TaxID=1796055 RepID=A0AAV9VIZ3_9PEZI
MPKTEVVEEARGSAVRRVLGITELLSEILYFVGLSRTPTAKGKVEGFKSLSKCLQVCKEWNYTIKGFSKHRKQLFIDDKLLEYPGSEVTICEPFVQDLIRWAEWRSYVDEELLEYLKRLPENVYFTQPPVQEVSFTFSTRFIRSLPPLRFSSSRFGYWHEDTLTYRYYSKDGVRALHVAKILQRIEMYLGKGTILGVAIGVPDSRPQNEGLPIWVDY